MASLKEIDSVEKEAQWTEQIEVSSTDSQAAQYAALVKRYNRKLDIRILPFMFLLFFFSFLDRSSIGNAAIAGLQQDVKLSGNQYNIALALFFVIYGVVEIPASWVFKWIGPKYYFSATIFCFGICTICLGLVKSSAQLYAIRCLLGFFEGGLTPCLWIYMAMYYRRFDIQSRVAAFYISAPLSSAFGGLIAAGAGQIRTSNYKGWPWIFFIEGATTVVVGIFCFLLMPNLPTQCKFLSDEERKVPSLQVDGRSNAREDFESEKFSWRKIKQGLVDWNTVCLSLASTGLYANIYAFSLFSPSIIKGFGFSTINSQLISVPPYIAGCIAVLTTSFISDRVRLRAPFIIGCCISQAIGWVLQIACNSTGPRYFGLFLIAMGVYSGIPPLGAWLANNMSPYYPRASAISMSGLCGTAGGIITTFTFMTVNGNKNQGGAIQLALSLWVIACCCALMAINWKENKLRAAGGRDYRLHNGKIPEHELGSRHPRFIYTM